MGNPHILLRVGARNERETDEMKRIHDVYETEQEAIAVVKFLLENGYSAYRQGKTVYIDDGGVDYGL